MREVSLPSTTAIPPPASIRFSSKSIAPCTWTSVAWSDRTHSRELRRTWRRSPTGSTKSPCRSCIPIGRPRNRLEDSCRGCPSVGRGGGRGQQVFIKKKGHQRRQRPKSREETPTTGSGNEGVTASQQMPPHRTKLNSQMTAAGMHIPQGFGRRPPYPGTAGVSPALSLPSDLAGEAGEGEKGRAGRPRSPGWQHAPNRKKGRWLTSGPSLGRKRPR